MKTWSMAINEQEGDIDTMPVALAKSLIPAKIGNKNPLRDNDTKTPAKNVTKDASPCPSSPPRIHLIINIPNNITSTMGRHNIFIINQDIHFLTKLLNILLNPLSVFGIALHHFGQNSRRASINSLITSHDSSNGIPPSQNNSQHAWKH